jgi:transcriptional regulator GlxA family with amidase domain
MDSAPGDDGIDKESVLADDLADMTKSPRFPPNPVRAIEVLAYQAVQLLDVTGPLQVFASANDMAQAQGAALPYAIRVVAMERQGVETSSGLGLATHALPAGNAPLDTLIVAGGKGVKAAVANAALLDWLRGRAASARRVASVCTGAFLLGASGMLDGRRATTHWSYCTEFARSYPRVKVEPDPIFINDGRIWTSAGVTAGIDLALALVEADLGRTIALALARHLVVFLKRSGGQAQFSTALSLQAAEDEFGSLHDWINTHLADEITLPLLAEQAGMSERSFSRRYVAATGMTPGRAVERLRVEAARRLLSESRHPVKRIAQRCGFGSEETMRRSFARVLAVTPQDYRVRFGA